MQREGPWHFELSRSAQRRSISAGFIIDATGPPGFLAQHLGIPSERITSMPATQAVYAHFVNVARLDELSPYLQDGSLPYPPDDAAVHHVFPGGWIWVLRFNNGITSAGAAYTSEAALSHLRDPEEIWGCLLERFPTLEKSFRPSTRTTPFYHAAQLSFQRRGVAGENWALLPSSAGFIDPLLSTGFALTLLGIRRLGEAFRRNSSLIQHAGETTADLDTTAHLIAALYAKMGSPEEFSLLCMLYFAAMSFTETAWRLNKEELASSFLLRNNKEFYANLLKIASQAQSNRPITRPEIERVIRPFDIAGLTEWRRENWYSVDFNNLISNAHKVQLSPAEIRKLLTPNSACVRKV
jgi:FADH2 O2-dependent halogenase